MAVFLGTSPLTDNAAWTSSILPRANQTSMHFDHDAVENVIRGRTVVGLVNVKTKNAAGSVVDVYCTLFWWFVILVMLTCNVFKQLYLLVRSAISI